MVRSCIHLCLTAAAAAVARPTPIASTQNEVFGIRVFDGFTFPHIGGDDGSRTLVGVNADSQSALMVYNSTGAGRLDGFNSTAVDPAGNYLEGFGDFTISASNHRAGVPLVTFVSSSGGASRVFLQLPGELLVQVASTGQVYEPAGGAFDMLEEPSVAVSDDKTECYVAFSAQVGKSWRGILLARISADAASTDEVVLTTVADTNTPIPAGNKSVNFTYLTGPQATPQGDVVFFGSHSGSSGSPMVEAQFNNIFGWKPADRVMSRMNGGLFLGEVINPGIWRYGQGTITDVAKFDSVVPDGQAGESFIAFSDVGVALDGTAAFVGLGNNGSYGIYKGSRTKPLSYVAGKQTPVPGYSNYTFQDVPNTVSLGPSGEVVFYGAVNSDIFGIFAEDPKTGALSTVINSEAHVDGQPVVYIGFGTQAYSNGLASAYMVLNDTTCGVWNLPVTHASSFPTVMV